MSTVETKDGLVLIDTGSSYYQYLLHKTIRTWSSKLVTHAVYTHRHVDHTGGIHIFDHENKLRGKPPVVAIGHTNIKPGFDRYKLTNGYNARINQKQFATPEAKWTTHFHYCDIEYERELKLTIGGVAFEFFHDKGETDDATWVYLPSQAIVFTGDFSIWAFPNCGNPQKVQRCPVC